MFWGAKVRLVAALLAVLAFGAAPTHGHGMMTIPMARNVVHDSNYCPHCLSAGGLSVVSQGNTLTWPAGVHGFCGDPADDRKHETGGIFGPTAPVATYTQGGIIEITLLITAQHGGRNVFRLCDRRDNLDEACFASNVLQRADGTGPYTWFPQKQGPAVPESGYGTGSMLGQPGELFTMQYWLPPGVTCQSCTLQWWWTTGNSCDVPGSPFPATGMSSCTAAPWSYPEEFWNCADITITPAAGGQPAATPAARTAAAVPATPSMATSAYATPIPPPATTAAVSCPVYTVQPGEYLYLIAGNLGVDINDIRALNPEIGDGSLLDIGQQLKVPPCTGGEQPPPATPAPVPAPAAQPALAPAPGPGLAIQLVEAPEAAPAGEPAPAGEALPQPAPAPGAAAVPEVPGIPPASGPSPSLPAPGPSPTLPTSDDILDGIWGPGSDGQAPKAAPSPSPLPSLPSPPPPTPPTSPSPPPPAPLSPPSPSPLPPSPPTPAPAPEPTSAPSPSPVPRIIVLQRSPSPSPSPAPTPPSPKPQSPPPPPAFKLELRGSHGADEDKATEAPSPAQDKAPGQGKGQLAEEGGKEPAPAPAPAPAPTPAPAPVNRKITVGDWNRR